MVARLHESGDSMSPTIHYMPKGVISGHELNLDCFCHPLLQVTEGVHEYRHRDECGTLAVAPGERSHCFVVADWRDLPTVLRPHWRRDRCSHIFIDSTGWKSLCSQLPGTEDHLDWVEERVVSDDILDQNWSDPDNWSKTVTS